MKKTYEIKNLDYNEISFVEQSLKRSISYYEDINVGDIIGPNGRFSSLSDFSKWILSVAMILGRLELFAILVLFIPSFWRKY